MLVSPDTSIHTVPALSQPAVGESYIDPVFGSRITRLTDSARMPDNARGSGFLNTVRPEYPTVCPWSLGNAWLTLQNGSYFGLYTGAGVYVSDLPFTISASSEPRWSRLYPNILYFHLAGGNALLSYNVATGQTETVRTFSEYSQISGGGESDTAGVGDFLVLAGDGKEAFVYDVVRDAKSIAVAIGPAFDSLYIAPDASKFTITEAGVINEYLTATGAALALPLCQSGSHMDVAGFSGRQFLVRTNSNDPKPLAGFPNAIELVDLAGGGATGLLSLPWSLAVHVSASDAGLAAVETYSALGAAWDVFSNEILAISLDGSTTTRAAHHRSAVAGYASMPLTALRRDGAFAVFGSNWGKASGAMDAYLIALGTPEIAGPPPPILTVPVVVAAPVVASVEPATVLSEAPVEPVSVDAPAAPISAAAAPAAVQTSALLTVSLLGNPEYAYKKPPAGWQDEDFEYVYDKTNTPMLNPGLLPGQSILNIPLPFERDAVYRVRSIEVLDPSGGWLGMRFRDAWGVRLSPGDVFVPSAVYTRSGASVPNDHELFCPSGSVMMVDITNLA